MRCAEMAKKQYEEIEPNYWSTNVKNLFLFKNCSFLSLSGYKQLDHSCSSAELNTPVYKDI